MGQEFDVTGRGHVVDTGCRRAVTCREFDDKFQAKGRGLRQDHREHGDDALALGDGDIFDADGEEVGLTDGKHRVLDAAGAGGGHGEVKFDRAVGENGGITEDGDIEGLKEFAIGEVEGAGDGQVVDAGDGGAGGRAVEDRDEAFTATRAFDGDGGEAGVFLRRCRR